MRAVNGQLNTEAETRTADVASLIPSRGDVRRRTSKRIENRAPEWRCRQLVLAQIAAENRSVTWFRTKKDQQAESLLIG